MLSILIPTYNYNVYPLVCELSAQCQTANIPFEVLVIDDHSTDIVPENTKINAVPNCSFIVLENNCGRSAVRNLLAKKAQYNWLLFLDSDVMPTQTNFISSYIGQIDNEVKLVNGGILYPDEKPEKEKILRWIYGRSREALSVKSRQQNPYLSCLSLNFLVHKSILNQVKFNESIPNLRHEDTLFSFNLKEKKIPVLHIHNPVFHFGLDTFDKAIKKENESLYALKYLIEKNLIAADYIRMGQMYSTLKKYQLTPLVQLFHRFAKPFLMKNLASQNPSMLFFDMYRISYLCTLRN
ncbi:glycosyl transferase [Flavobacterium faecale]|uniref:Glycosyl transferase n=1 Tax=Flavobacterium faecale TaxID=1355330 RepID=A0A2S1LE88_9FLAO|nr:glycosyltransferase [Flavobacterium faecale]AWG22092.1 glycosyl transferase [Flavobacterium faecale]